jgi:transposase
MVAVANVPRIVLIRIAATSSPAKRRYSSRSTDACAAISMADLHLFSHPCSWQAQPVWWVVVHFACPHCHQECPVYDHAPERRWRHLDAMKFKTYLTTRTPQIRCLEHGVVSVSLPWAGFSSCWTIDLECRVIDTLQACSSLQAAAKLLNVSWSTLQSIIAAAVARGLDRRSLESLRLLGWMKRVF